MLVLFEFVLDHIDDVLAIVCGQFLKVLFGRWIDGWMKRAAARKVVQEQQPGELLLPSA
ncbi:MAG: hypothetical protein IGS39_01785 [Calothrix sp. C42_A2020_038]|nr:hypothetical protein [Calothrix sp. C42_A2020_038]